VSVAAAALAASAAGLALANGLHCAGMCGAFALTAKGRPEWHAGRATTYLVLGAAAGAIGGVFGGGAPSIRLAAAILASLVLVLFCLQLGGFLSRSIGASAPLRPLAALLRSVARPDGGGVTALAGRFALGAAGSLVPCGVVYAGLALASVAGSAAGGALVMGGFALGTAPALILTAAGRRLFGEWGRRLLVRRAAALLALALGLTSIWVRAPLTNATGEAAAEAPACHTVP